MAHILVWFVPRTYIDIRLSHNPSEANLGHEPIFLPEGASSIHIGF